MKDILMDLMKFVGWMLFMNMNTAKEQSGILRKAIMLMPVISYFWLHGQRPEEIEEGT